MRGEWGRAGVGCLRATARKSPDLPKVIDPRQPQQPAVVRLSIDGVAVVQAPTGVDRPDVVAGNPSFNPVPGYQATVPTSPGAHQVCLDLVYDSGRTARLGCSEVIV